jgi:hypothetical protein
MVAVLELFCAESSPLSKDQWLKAGWLKKEVPSGFTARTTVSISNNRKQNSHGDIDMVTTRIEDEGKIPSPAVLMLAIVKRKCRNGN